MTSLYADGLVPYQKKNTEMVEKLVLSLQSITSTNLGIYTLGIFLLVHAYNKSKNNPILPIDTTSLSNHMKSEIAKKYNQIKKEKINFNAPLFSDGFLGALRRMSETTVKFKGNDFFLV